MNRHLNRHHTSVMIAVFAAAMLYPAPATADHRPGNVVVMGGTLSLTGPYAVPAGRNLNGFKLYVDDLNTRGGLLGHSVELKIYDDKSDRGICVELYKKLFAEGKIDLYLSPYSSGFIDSVANIFERYKQPIVQSASALSVYERGRKYLFGAPAVPAPVRQKGALHLARQIGVTRIAIIGSGNTTHRQVSIGALEWAKKLGLEVVLLESYREGQTDFRPLLRRIEASGAEAIISAPMYPDAVTQARQLRDLNINVKLFAALVGPATPKFVEELGSAAEFTVGPAPWVPKPALGHPGIREFIDKYERRHGVKPNYHVAGTWAEMQVIEAAVKEAGSFDPEKVRNALASISVYTMRGQYKANEQGRSAPSEGVVIQIQNGKRVIVWPKRFAEAKLLLMPKWEDRAKK